VYELLQVADPKGQEPSYVLVVEWIDGKRLYDPAVQAMQRDNKSFFALVDRLMVLLTCMHAHGMVHGDAHGDNVLIRDSDRQPVLIDLDELCDTSDTTAMGCATRPTSAWVSPEDASQSFTRGWRERTDVFNVLATLLLNDVNVSGVPVLPVGTTAAAAIVAADARAFRQRDPEIWRSFVNRYIKDPRRAAFYVATMGPPKIATANAVRRSADATLADLERQQQHRG
jgi:serine/threonine protein kinase